MSNVLTVEAKLNGDATGLVGAAQKAADALAKMEASGKRVGKLSGIFDELGYKVGVGLGAVIGNAAKLGDGIVQVTGRVIKTLGGLVLKTAAVGAGVAAVFAGSAMKAGLDRLMSIQDATVALTRMLGSAEKAADLTQKALKVVQGTPFAFPQFAEATRTLVAFGVKTEKIPGILQAIADSAAASGRGADAVNGITQAFANMAVSGKINSDIIQSLGTSGVNALGILANHFKVSTGEAQEMVTKGLIPADEAMDILVRGIEEGSHGIAGDFNSLSGAAQDLGKTISGSIGNVKAAFARMGATWLKPFEQDFPDVMNKGVIPLLDKVGAAGQVMMQKLADTGILSKITEGFQWLTEKVDPAAQSFLDIITALSPLKIAFETLSPYLPLMKDQFADVGKLVMSDLVPALGSLIEALIPLLPAFVDLLTAGINGFVEVMPSVVTVVKTLVDIFGPLLHAVADLPGPILGVITVLGTLSAMGVPVTGMFQGLATLIMNTAATFTTGATTMGTASTLAFGPWGIAIAGAAAILLGFIGQQVAVQQAIDNVAASLDTQTGAYTENTKALVVKQLSESGAYKAALDLGIAQDTLTLAMMGNSEALDIVDAARQKYQDGYNAAKIDVAETSAWVTLDDALGKTTNMMEEGRKKDQERAIQMATLHEALDVLKQRSEDATVAVQTNGATMDQATTAGQKNKTALDNLATASQAVVDAMIKEGASHVDIDGKLQSNQNQFVDLATKMGMGRDEATKLATEMIAIPNVERTVTINAGGAYATLSELERRMGGMGGSLASIQAHAAERGYARGGIVKAMARGGIIGNITHAAQGLSRVSQMAKGGDNITWAEPETGWEAYISGNDKAKQRNQAVWMEAGKKLGMFEGAEGGGGGTVNNYEIKVYTIADVNSVAAEVLAQIRFANGG